MAEEEIARILPELTQLRRDLHQYPELSGQEESTARYLKAYLQKYMPDAILTRLGSGTGLAAVFKGPAPGPTIMFRADMDALPIPQESTASYASQHEGISHKCGHDGHMTMVAGLAPLLHRHRPKRGKVVLLMQPAEETGEGAIALLEDKQFRELKPDYIFGLHNLPGFPMGQLVLREGSFCATSRGMRVRLKGRTSHAAEPEQGHSPATALAQLMISLPQLPQALSPQELLLVTLTHASLGEPTFGTSPGIGMLQATLRANLEEEMQLLIQTAEAHIHKIAAEAKLEVEISYHEVFPLTKNEPEVFELLKRAADKTALDIHLKEEPFRWSEDFGHYSKLAPSGFFGLGSGSKQPNLHNAAYDFPDELLPYGLRMYWKLLEEVLA